MMRLLLLWPLLAVATAAYCGTNGTHGLEAPEDEHDVALEAMLPIACALLLAFVASSSMEALQITFFPAPRARIESRERQKQPVFEGKAQFFEGKYMKTPCFGSKTGVDNSFCACKTPRSRVW